MSRIHPYPLRSTRRAVGWAAGLLAAAVLLACGGGDRSQATQAPAPTAAPTISADAPLGTNLIPLTFTNSAGAKVNVSVRVEGNEPAREHGLMNVLKLPDNLGDLFVWSDVAPNRDVAVQFWMKDTLLPLSIAFISSDGHVLEEQDMQAETTTLHTPHQPYRFALEVNQGWFDRNGIPVGATVNLPEALSASTPTATAR
jgi:uncharacterized membrane protein (UPF0127 family)